VSPVVVELAAAFNSNAPGLTDSDATAFSETQKSLQAVLSRKSASAGITTAARRTKLWPIRDMAFSTLTL
jgi:hypothetical protein